MPGMEEFSLLSISGPRLSLSLSALQDAASSPATSLPGPEPGHPGERMFSKRHPDNAKMGAPAEPAGPPQILVAQAPGSLTCHGVDSPTLTPDRPLDMGECPRRRCSVYRPWFSPYSYFVCADRGGRLEASGCREGPWDEGRGDGWPAEDAGAESLGSSSSSPEHAGAPRGRAWPESSVTSQDILAACRGQLVQQSGYKCAACCRLYPTLHSLKSHIRSGAREGFSCGVYYRKLKALWGGQRARPGAGGQPCP